MNIKKALKEKNKLVNDINKLWSIVKGNNSYEAGNPIHFSVPDALEEIEEKIEKLVTLKVAIHKANFEVYSLIFRMSELKSMIKNLSAVCTEEGKIITHYSSTIGNKEVQLNSLQIAIMIKSIQEEIDSIQDELDVFNVSTLVNLEY